MSDFIKDILKKHQLRVTLGRELVLLTLNNASKALSHGELTELLKAKINRATLYRTLQDFEEAGIVHKVPDDEVSVKYALCTSHCQTHHHKDDHVHFKCQACGETKCLEGVSIPLFQLQEGYKLNSSSVLLTGVCPGCAA